MQERTVTAAASPQHHSLRRKAVLVSALCVGLAGMADWAGAQSGQAQGSQAQAGQAQAGQAQTAQAQGGQRQGGQQQAGQAGAGAPQGAAILLVAPQVASDQNLANGCWVRFFDGENFTGPSLTLAGPMEMPSMYPAGSIWRDWESAIVGPRARVTTFDEQNFRERTATLMPSQRIAELREHPKLGWFDEVHSARVTCTG